MFFTSSISSNKTVSKTQMLQVTFTLWPTVIFWPVMSIKNSKTVHGRVAHICCKNIKFFSENEKQMQYRMFKKSLCSYHYCSGNVALSRWGKAGEAAPQLVILSTHRSWANHELRVVCNCYQFCVCNNIWCAVCLSDQSLSTPCMNTKAKLIMYSMPINITQKLMQYHRSKSAVILCIYSKISDLRNRLTDRSNVTGHADMSAAWAVWKKAVSVHLPSSCFLSKNMNIKMHNTVISCLFLCMGVGFALCH